jgi:hypothetical protein
LLLQIMLLPSSPLPLPLLPPQCSLRRTCA